jgi:hypothetical protein
MTPQERHFTELPLQRQLLKLPMGTIGKHLTVLLWVVLLVMLGLGSLSAHRFFPETVALKEASLAAGAGNRDCSPLHFPPGALQRLPSTMDGDDPEGEHSYYLVTHQGNPSFPSPLPLHPNLGLARLAAYAAAHQEGCANAAAIQGMAPGGLLPAPQAPTTFQISDQAPCPLALIRATQVHPGLRVISGPFGADGQPGPDGETLDLTILGPVNEPGWLTALSALRRSWGGEPDNPFDQFLALAGRGRLLVPAGPDWQGHTKVDPNQNLGRWFAAMLRPPYPTYPLLLSLASAPTAPEAVRRSVELALSAPYIRRTEAPADMENPTNGPTVVRALGRPGVVLWELVVPYASADTWISRIEAGLANKAGLDSASTEDFSVALVHWTRMPVDCHAPSEKMVNLLNALAEVGFDLVVGVGGGPGPGPVWARGEALVASNLGDFTGASDILGGVGFREDLGLLLQCTRLGAKPFQCYALPIQRYMGKPQVAFTPKPRAAGPCLWRQQDWRRTLVEDRQVQGETP